MLCTKKQRTKGVESAKNDLKMPSANAHLSALYGRIAMRPYPFRVALLRFGRIYH